MPQVLSGAARAFLSQHSDYAAGRGHEGLARLVKRNLGFAARQIAMEDQTAMSVGAACQEKSTVS